mgnify:CR=1 FL=1
MASNTPVPWLTPKFLHAVGPNGLVRATERLLWSLGFEDVRVIDGSRDRGGDILAVRNREQWVIQSKWSSSGPISADGVNEVNEAFQYYRADTAVLVTNTTVSGPARKRAKSLKALGLNISLWEGATLQEVGSRIPTHTRGYEPRTYQKRAIARVEADLKKTGRGLLILATGLGKTLIGGQVIARRLAANPSSRILVLSHLKDLSSQLEKEMWHHIPKSVATGLLTGDSKPYTMDGLVTATIESALNAVYEGYRPDLIMIDGGKGQVNAAREALTILGLDDLALS